VSLRDVLCASRILESTRDRKYLLLEFSPAGPGLLQALVDTPANDLGNRHAFLLRDPADPSGLLLRKLNLRSHHGINVSTSCCYSNEFSFVKRRPTLHYGRSSLSRISFDHSSSPFTSHTVTFITRSLLGPEKSIVAKLCSTNSVPGSAK